jgi:hypothetical protein
MLGVDDGFEAGWIIALIGAGLAAWVPLFKTHICRWICAAGRMLCAGSVWVLFTTYRRTLSYGGQ